MQRFLEKYLKEDVNRVALSKSPFAGVSSRELAEQLDGKQRAQKKLPLWCDTSGIIFPAKLSIEQSSSQLTAEYKSRLAKGDKLIDLTGGLGVDSFFFSKVVREVIHCEENSELSQIAEHNLGILGARNVRFLSTDSIQYLKTTDETFDTIYIDPSRRVKSQKVFLLQDTEPDVVSNLPLLLSKAARIIIKTSPLFDIQLGLKELANVSQVHVMSVKNDCKELLWIIDRGHTAEAEIVCAAISPDSCSRFSFTFSDERNLSVDSYAAPLRYVYEPDVALLKAGCFKSITSRFKIKKLHQNSHLYTSDEIVPDFVGKTFRIETVQDYKTFIKENRIKKANVISRNFPHTPDELKKKHKIADGGELFMFFTTVFPDKLQVIIGIGNP